MLLNDTSSLNTYKVIRRFLARATKTFIKDFELAKLPKVVHDTIQAPF